MRNNFLGNMFAGVPSFPRSQPSATPPANNGGQPPAETINANPMVTTQVAGTPNATGGQQQQQTPAGNGQQTPPNNTSPLDKFTPLFQTDPTKAQKGLFDDPFFPKDQFDQLNQAISQQSYAQVTPETMQKIMSGDTQALQQLLNSSVQAAIMQMTQLTNGMITQSLQGYHARFTPELDNRLNAYHGQQSFASQNEKLNHPALQPMINALRTQFMQANPTMSPQQINKEIETYLVQAGQVFNVNGNGAGGVGTDPITGANSQRQANKAVDWNSWFNQGK